MSVVQGFSQNDTLFSLLKTVHTDTEKAYIYVQLFKNIKPINQDSAIFYLDMADSLLRESECTEPDPFLELGTAYQDASDYTKGLFYHRRAAEASHVKGDYTNYAMYMLYGIYGLTVAGDYNLAIEELHNIEDYCVSQETHKGLMRCYLIYGFAYRNFNQEKALGYFEQVINLSGRDTLENDLNYALHETGNLYVVMGKYDLAIQYYDRALKIREAIGEKIVLSYSYHDISSTYIAVERYDKALETLFKSLELTDELKDSWGKAITLANIGDVYRYLKSYTSAFSYLEQADSIARIINVKPVWIEVYDKYHKLCAETGDFENSLRYYKLSIAYRDSVTNENQQKELAILDRKFETEKKDQLLAEKELKIGNQRRLIWVGLAAILMFISFLIMVYRQYKLKHEANQKLTEQNTEIEAQRNEIEAQRDMVVEQKNQIEIILQEQNASLRYARQIQQAMLPEDQTMRKLFSEHFVLYFPQQIVGGDFYWTHHNQDHIWIAVADSTGHGAPGAFMSILGMSILSELVLNYGHENPAVILQMMRESTIRELQQKQTIGSFKDGFDIGLCRINTSTLMMEFAGANNPALVVSQKLAKNEGLLERSHEDQHFALAELKPDKMPVGIHIRMDNFTNRSIQLHRGDCIYLLSDGYADQFGGERGNKLKIKALKEMILEDCHLPLSDQRENLVKAFRDWQGARDQVDDVTVVGIKI